MDKFKSGIFIDLDGTLANSLSVMRVVYDKFLHSFDRLGTTEEFNRLNGPPLAVVVADLAQTHALKGNIEDLLKFYWELIESAYETVDPNPGALELLKTAKDCNIPTAVVTSNMSFLAEAWLKRLGAKNYIDTIIGGDSVQRGKPDPEPYLRALTRLGCSAPHSFAVEDSLTGVRAAAAAGLKTFFLSSGSDAAPPEVTKISSLDEVTCVILESQKSGLLR